MDPSQPFTAAGTGTMTAAGGCQAPPCRPVARLRRAVARRLLGAAPRLLAALGLEAPSAQRRPRLKGNAPAFVRR